ncbi:P-loop containing nucleoside triphosphate hydrolase protein [Xylaria grammica]|nr:P-loop containing nucleoside triphosphate hydrolase protein [Xylaria grammica]
MGNNTEISFDDNNHGTQVGQNFGSITNQFHLSPESSETPLKPSLIIPFDRDKCFVERKSILDRLCETYSTSAPPCHSRIALVGLGGVGKSQLAIEHAYRVRDAFAQNGKGIWVFWVHSSTRLRVEQGLRMIADTIKIPGRNESKADILQLVYQWLQNERNGRWLMILDSADDIDAFYGVGQHEKQPSAASEGKRALWSYLPQSSNGLILVTTRNRELAFRLTGHQNNNIIDVGPMDNANALELLAKRLGSQFDETNGKELAEALEYMPLAISQAAAYIQHRAPRTSVESFLKDLRSESKQTMLLNHDIGDLRRDSDASNSIITTWQISFDYIRRKRSSATDLLSLMSFFDHQSIPEFLIRPIYRNDSSTTASATREGSDDDSTEPSETSNREFNEDVQILRDYCLISTNETGDAFEMHRLVQLSTRTWLDVHKQAEKFKNQYISRMAMKFPWPEFGNWDICRKLFPHVERAIHYKPLDQGSLLEWALVMRKGSQYSKDQGRYTAAELLAEKAFNVYKAEKGAEDEDTLGAMSYLAAAYYEQDRYSEAELLQTQLMEINLRVRGPEHSETLINMNDLALTYTKQGRWEEAESFDSQILEKAKRLFGPNHPKALTIMHNLASTLVEQGRFEEAESLSVEVIKLRKEVLGPNHPNTLISMDNLADLFTDQRRWDEAEPLLVEIVKMRKETLGPDHPDTLICMGKLATVFLFQNRLDVAESLFVPLLETQKAVLGPDHPEALICMSNLALTWYDQGHKRKAIGLMDQCAQGQIRAQGLEHSNTQNALSILQEWRDEETVSSEGEAAGSCSTQEA